MVISKSSKLVKASKASSTGDGIDRLSNLPEPLISVILSLLPTKCAVATSVLSTRWKFLWTSITNLVFENFVDDHEDLSRKALIMKMNKFAYFVNRVLLLVLLNPHSIQNFRLTLTHELPSPSYINLWIRVAFGRTVRELVLFLCLDVPFELPLSHIYCNVAVLKLEGDIHFNIRAAASVCFPSLHTLHLCDVKFAIANDSSVSFPNLKILRLGSVDYGNEDSVHKLFSSCPVLDDLVIVRTDWDNVLCLVICIPSLTRLTLLFDFHHKEERMYKLRIDTPALQYLDLDICIPCEYLRGECLCSLLEAKIRLSYIDAKAVERCLSIFKFIESLSNVRFLSLLGYALTAIMTVPPNFSSGFRNLTRLELECLNCVDSSILINNFLGSMDNLEHLVMKGWCICSDQQSWWTEHLDVPKCLLLRVTTISFTGITVGCCGQLELLRYFLKNAKVLQLLTIGSYLRSKEKRRLLQKISAYPWGSQTCQVEFT